MGKKTSLNKEHETALPDTQFEGSRARRRERKRLNLRTLKGAPSREEIDFEISKFEKKSFLHESSKFAWGLESSRSMMSSLVGDLVWRRLCYQGSDGRRATVYDVERLVNRRVAQVDRDLLRRDDFPAVAVLRIGIDQFEVQRDPMSDVYRSMQLFDDSHPGLPVPLETFVLAVWVLYCRLREPATKAEIVDYLRDLGDATTQQVMKVLDLLAIDEGDTLASPSAEENNPLREKPIVRVGAHYVCPAPQYLLNCSSPVGLYVRGIHASASSRRFSSAVGNRAAAFLGEQLEVLQDAGWSVVNVDDRVTAGSNVGEHADFVLIAPNEAFVVIIEMKATLQTRNARMGEKVKLNESARLYKKAFMQVHETRTLFGQKSPIDLEDVPADKPVFGLAVTLENHFVVNIDGTVYPGLPIGRRPPWDGAEPVGTPCTVTSFEELDHLLDCLPSLQVKTVQELFLAVTTETNPGRPLRKILTEICPECFSSANQKGASIIHKLAANSIA